MQSSFIISVNIFKKIIYTTIYSSNYFCRDASNNRIIWHIFNNNRISANYNIIANFNIAKYTRASRYVYIITYRWHTPWIKLTSNSNILSYNNIITYDSTAMNHDTDRTISKLTISAYNDRIRNYGVENKKYQIFK
ncbi:hypothetical protein ABIE60_003105 [Marinobacterium sp. MBR-109]